MESICSYTRLRELSRPAWGAWIEITAEVGIEYFIPVAPRMGRVD